MSSEISIKVENLSKCYQIYEQPRDRLKQFIVPRLQRAIGQPSRQYFREFWALQRRFLRESRRAKPSASSVAMAVANPRFCR